MTSFHTKLKLLESFTNPRAFNSSKTSVKWPGVKGVMLLNKGEFVSSHLHILLFLKLPVMYCELEKSKAPFYSRSRVESLSLQFSGVWYLGFMISLHWKLKLFESLSSNPMSKCKVALFKVSNQRGNATEQRRICDKPKKTRARTLDIS